MSVHDSIRRRETLRHKAELLAKKNEFPIHLPPETPPTITKSYYMAGFGLQATKPRSKRGQTQVSQAVTTGQEQAKEEQLIPLGSSKTFFEDVPFSSNLGRKVLKDRQSITSSSEVSCFPWLRYGALNTYCEHWRCDSKVTVVEARLFKKAYVLESVNYG